MPDIKMPEILRRSRPLLPIIGTGLVMLLLPVVISGSYELSLLAGLCETLLMLTGLNLISGYGGQISLGQGTFFGIGAYFAAISTLKWGLPPGLGFILAPLVTAGIAAVLGVPSLRLRGLYFAMATLGIAVVFEDWLNNAVGWTGGPNGLSITSVLTLAGIKFASPESIYYLAAALAVIGLIVSHLFLRSRMGWSLRAASASEPAAATVGIATFRVRLVAFMLSGAFAGVAGSLEAYHTGYISPSTFTYSESILLFVVLTIGGLGRFSGPLIGAFLLYAFSRWFDGLANTEPLIIAGVFILGLRFFPRGVVPAVSDLAHRLGLSRPAPEPADAPAPAVAAVATAPTLEQILTETSDR
jgi:branched-chain amino acid transport system permease protein